ncbi:MAG: hypothetical protein U0573_12630 [Phycisphaerales bacterium]
MRRQLYHVAISILLIAISLSVGAVGYHWLAELDWVDSYYNAAMILTGMGPASPPKNNAAKIFASGYALFSAVIFLSVASVLIAPGLHRMLHKLHRETPPPDKK